jgi:hypothetical protein
MQKEKIRELINRYMAGQLSSSEEEELLQLIAPGDDAMALEVLQNMIQENAANTPLPGSNPDPGLLLQKILSVDKPLPPPAIIRHLLWRRFAIACCFILAVGLSYYFWPVKGDNQSRPSHLNPYTVINDAPPGSQGAYLTLGNGQKILLDSQSRGEIAKQGNTTISIKDGRLIYDAGTTGPEIYYNTMSTPKGRHYQLTLPDGSEVWLNAASSITYPTAFSASERKVTITGEAYFEVAKDKTRPFRVNVNDQTEVEVLGTHFNINAYADEGTIRTTLLEGSVKVIGNGKQAVISPGQQVISGTQFSIIKNADVAQATAWRTGYFNFNNTDIRLVIKQLERWYDVDVAFEGTLKPKLIYGKMQRDLYLSQVLDILKKLGVKYRLEGKKLTIIP